MSVARARAMAVAEAVVAAVMEAVVAAVMRVVVARSLIAVGRRQTLGCGASFAGAEWRRRVNGGEGARRLWADARRNVARMAAWASAWQRCTTCLGEVAARS